MARVTPATRWCCSSSNSAAVPDRRCAEKLARLQQPIKRGVVEPDGADKAPAKYQLTAKAVEILTKRGVGINEA